MNELLSKEDLGNLLGLGKTAIATLVKRSDFPAAIRINGRTFRWDKSEVAAWIQFAKRSNQGNTEVAKSQSRNRRSYVVAGIEFSEVNR